MAFAHQSKHSHDKTATHASTDASQVGPGKQTMVEARAADAQGPAGGGVEAEASGHKRSKKDTEDEAIFQLGAYYQRVRDAYDDVIDKVGRSKNLQQAASTALGAAGSLLADRAGEAIGKGLGFVIGKITDKIAESLGEKFPEVEGDKTAANYLEQAKKKASHAIHSEAKKIPHHHPTMAELHALLKFLHSDAASKKAIKDYVNQKLSDYQNSVELMYEHSRDINPVHGELVQESPVLGHVPDPARGNKLHLAVVQATRHHLPTDPKPFNTWALLRFIPNGLGPEANAVMDKQHAGQPIRTFKLLHPGQVQRGIAPV